MVALKVRNPPKQFVHLLYSIWSEALYVCSTSAWVLLNIYTQKQMDYNSLVISEPSLWNGTKWFQSIDNNRAAEIKMRKRQSNQTISHDSSGEQINDDRNESNATWAFIPVIVSIGRKLAIFSCSTAVRFDYIHLRESQSLSEICISLTGRIRGKKSYLIKCVEKECESYGGETSKQI